MPYKNDKEFIGFLFITSLFSDMSEPPRNLKVVSIDKQKAKLKWDPPKNDGGSPIEGYIVEKQVGNTNRWQRVNKVPLKDCDAEIDDLVEGQEYKFRVCAVTAAGNGKPATTDEVIAKDPYGKSKYNTKPRMFRLPVKVYGAVFVLKKKKMNFPKKKNNFFLKMSPPHTIWSTT